MPGGLVPPQLYDVWPWQPALSLLLIRRQLWEELEERVLCVVGFLTLRSFWSGSRACPSTVGGRETTALQSEVTQQEMARGRGKNLGA